MRIAIIGSGNVGRALATSFTRAGHEVTITAQDPEHARAAASDAGATAHESNVAAAAASDVIVLAVPFFEVGSRDRSERSGLSAFSP